MKKNRIKISGSLRKMLLCVMTAVLLIFGGSTIAMAASNPYGQWQTINGVTTQRCTWYAWKMAYERAGVALPGLGNGGSWYDNAARAGYSVGTAAKANSIAVWTDSGYGHVAYVSSVSGSKMFVLEGGRTDKAGAPNYGIGTATVSSTAGSYRNYGTQRLKGFIYLDKAATFNVSYGSLSLGSISNTNAQINARISNPSRYCINKVGAYLWDSKGNLLKNHTEYCGLSYSGFNQGFNVQSEGNVTLTSGSYYTCQFYAISGNQVAYSQKFTFKTTGCAPSGNNTSQKTTVNLGTSRITSIKGSYSKGMTVIWNRLSNVSGYQVKVAVKSSMSGAKVFNVSSKYNGLKFSGLSKKTTYYVQVRAYRTANGKTTYNSWSSRKSLYSGR